MQTPSTRQLLRRHAVAFAVAFLSLTAVLLAIFMSRQWPEMASRGLPNGDIARVLLLAVPFTAAMTIPMAVFVGVLWVFARLGSLGSLAVARQERDGVRRLLVPVLGAAAVVAGLTLVWNSEVVPRANDRLVAVREAGRSASPARSDRAMTAGELRAAERRVRSEGGPDASRLAANYEVEFQKKFALAAACVLLALAGAAIALRFPRGGTWLVIGASVAVFGAYYFCMVTGETLADRMAVSPFIGMWSANGLLLAGALLLLPRGRGRVSPHGTEPAVIGG